MTDINDKYIEEFVAAAKELDNDKLKELSIQKAGLSLQDRVDLLTKLTAEMTKAEVHEQVLEGMKEVLNQIKYTIEANEAAGVKDSNSEVAKETTEAVEATQDVAADTVAAEADAPAVEADSEGEAEGEAPAEEEKEEKSEDKA